MARLIPSSKTRPQILQINKTVLLTIASFIFKNQYNNPKQSGKRGTC